MQGVAPLVPETRLESELRDVQTALHLWQHMAAAPHASDAHREHAQERLRAIEQRMFTVLNQLGSELRAKQPNAA